MADSASPRRRRRELSNEVVTIFWRDIPAQVTAHVDGARASWLLDQRFQVAIDRAATVAGLTNADDYVRQWRRTSDRCSGDPQEAARATAESLERHYGSARVADLVTNGGLEPTTPTPTIGETAGERQP